MKSYLKTGDVLAGCEVISCLGIGGSGEVYLVRRRKDGMTLALKILSPSAMRADPGIRERFIREARIATTLQHKNLIRVFDSGTDPASKMTYMLMEYVDGGSLHDFLNGGTIHESKALYVASQVAEALDYASRYRLVHRDIKPDNILLSRSGDVKLADMGIARVSGHAFGGTLTMDNAVVGTPSYSSPEQCRASHDVDTRADIYSIGACLYEMVTGRPPFMGKNPFDIIEKVLKADLIPPQKIRFEVSDPMNDLICRMLARNPEDRPQTPGKLLDELAVVSELYPDSDCTVEFHSRGARLRRKFFSTMTVFAQRTTEYLHAVPAWKILKHVILDSLIIVCSLVLFFQGAIWWDRFTARYFPEGLPFQEKSDTVRYWNGNRALPKVVKKAKKTLPAEPVKKAETLPVEPAKKAETLLPVEPAKKAETLSAETEKNRKAAQESEAAVLTLQEAIRGKNFQKCVQLFQSHFMPLLRSGRLPEILKELKNAFPKRDLSRIPYIYLSYRAEMVLQSRNGAEEMRKNAHDLLLFLLKSGLENLPVRLAVYPVAKKDPLLRDIYLTFLSIPPKQKKNRISASRMTCVYTFLTDPDPGSAEECREIVQAMKKGSIPAFPNLVDRTASDMLFSILQENGYSHSGKYPPVVLEFYRRLHPSLPEIAPEKMQEYLKLTGPNLRFPDGQSLFFRALKNSLAAAETVLKAGGNVEDSGFADSPLEILTNSHETLTKKRKDQILFLLNNGADPNRERKKGLSAAQIAQQRNHAELSDLFRQYAASKQNPAWKPVPLQDGMLLKLDFNHPNEYAETKLPFSSLKNGIFVSSPNSNLVLPVRGLNPHACTISIRFSISGRTFNSREKLLLDFQNGFSIWVQQGYLLVKLAPASSRRRKTDLYHSRISLTPSAWMILNLSMNRREGYMILELNGKRENASIPAGNAPFSMNSALVTIGPALNQADYFYISSRLLPKPPVLERADRRQAERAIHFQAECQDLHTGYKINMNPVGITQRNRMVDLAKKKQKRIRSLLMEYSDLQDLPAYRQLKEEDAECESFIWKYDSFLQH